MKAGFEILWTDQAANGLDSIVHYLSEEFSVATVNTYLDDFFQLMRQICEFPEGYPTSGYRKDVRRAILNRYTSIYYTIGNKKVILLAVRDSRQSKNF